MLIHYYDDEWYPVLSVEEIDERSEFFRDAEVPAEAVAEYEAAIEAFTHAETKMRDIIAKALECA